MSTSILVLLFFCAVKEISSIDFDAVKEEMFKTNHLLEQLNIPERKEVVFIMAKNTEKTYNNINSYFLPSSDDLRGIVLIERIIQNYLQLYFKQINRKIKTPDHLNTSLFDEFEIRYDLMTNVFVVSKNLFDVLCNNTLLKSMRSGLKRSVRTEQLVEPRQNLIIGTSGFLFLNEGDK
ncbi:uncharacterized protein LOC126904340 isoform X1 [Daktulosphaira vitifoliae]|uniref:uncharacterized protein LOC126904340 isoform X1 n=1 Tax=Daktulosphaira vitifoliae TaxID=58002 RepID=UPI0021AADA1F|nr:uncharacterized protein LOC126904340 isoform X1 [Daktulosphaira vitifoliae]XP_050539290.1 uncharacterized protein LOC126904340 isoform X2 [Daktulosphaira vitifoliae]XP_050539298.1 uncharacterized protein LOC126904340 isoform X1 [Daktulosphaira vitifoliae]